MTAELHSLPRVGGGTRSPMVPGNVFLKRLDGCLLEFDDMCLKTSARLLKPHVRGARYELQMMSMLQNPSGTLPNDDDELALLAGFFDDVDGFREVKAKAMMDWVLCSDGRWHHPLRAKNVLHCWIARLETNRRSAVGNGAKSVKVQRVVAVIEDDIKAAAEALCLLNPSDKFLTELEARMEKWHPREHVAIVCSEASESLTTEIEGVTAAVTPGIEGVTAAVTPGIEGVTAAVTPGSTPHHGSPKIRQAKLSEAKLRKESSSDLRSEDSCVPEKSEQQEFEQEGGSPPPAGVVPPKNRDSEPWPRDALAQLEAVYPNFQNPGEVEKVLTSLRKAGKTPFSVILAGAERLRNDPRDIKFFPYPARWLKARGWENSPRPNPNVRPRDPPHAGPKPNIWFEAYRANWSDQP